MYDNQILINQNQDDLVNELINKKIIQSLNVANVMRSIDRADFLNFKFTDIRNTYIDTSHSINYNVVISAPHMHAYALELMSEKLLNSKKVLDVGSGTGYLTLAFRKLMQRNDSVSYGIEHIQELVDTSLHNISKNHLNYIQTGAVVIKEGDGRYGFNKFAPFDVIHVGAAADQIPKEIINQLANGGKLVIPLGIPGNQWFTVIDKDKYGNLKQQQVIGVNYVPLTSKNDQLLLLK